MSELPSASRPLRRRKRILKALFYILSVLIAFLLYGDPGLTLFGTKPNLMLGLLASSLFFEGPCLCCGLALGCGFLTDLLRQTPFGVNGLLFLVLAFLLWSVIRLWLRPVLPNALAAALVLAFAAQVLDFLLVYGSGSGLFGKLYLADTLVSVAFVFLWFFPVREVAKRLRFVL